MTNEAIQKSRTFFTKSTRKIRRRKKQPVSAHPFEPINHLPEEQLADKNISRAINNCERACGNDSH